MVGAHAGGALHPLPAHVEQGMLRSDIVEAVFFAQLLAFDQLFE